MSINIGDILDEAEIVKSYIFRTLIMDAFCHVCFKMPKWLFRVFKWE